MSDSTRRSMFGMLAAAVGIIATPKVVAQEGSRDARYLFVLANTGASFSVDAANFDPQFIFGLVTAASEHGGSVTIRSAAALSAKQAMILARPNVTFEF